MNAHMCVYEVFVCAGMLFFGHVFVVLSLVLFVCLRDIVLVCFFRMCSLVCAVYLYDMYACMICPCYVYACMHV